MSAEKWVIDKSTLEDIGDAIRTKEGSSDDIPVTEMKPRILAIQTGEDTSDATASEDDVLSGETFYADGKKKTGNIPVNSPSNKELPWTITTMPQGNGDATIKIPVTAGYYEEGQYPSTALPMKFQSDITPGTSDITVPGGAYYPGSFKVKGDTELIAENIKKGVEIFGKTGTYTSDADAAATDIAKDKTAYVNGAKVTGSVETTTGNQNAYGNEITQPDGATYLVVSHPFSEPHLYREGSALKMRCPLTNFGDATAADVLSGKTFTSTAGLKITGTMASGKQVYSGTFTSGLLSASLTIPVGVSLSDSDTFVLVYTGERYSGTSRDEGKLVTSAVKNGSNNMIVFVEGYYDGYDPYPVVVTATDSITFSGTNVTVSSGSSDTHFCSKESYCWYLIKG